MVNPARLVSRVVCAGLAAALGLASSGCREPAEPPAAELDTNVSARSQPRPTGLDGQRLEPLGANERPDALIFIRTDCPISNRYAPRLAALAERFASSPLDLWLVYVDPDEDARAIREHIEAYALPGTPIRDPGQVLVAAAQARVTPEAAVFDAAGTLRYHGRIDDWYVDFGQSRAAPSTAELADALTAVLEGSPVSIAETQAVGCPLPPVLEPGPDRR